jgi:TonB family protein
MALTGQLSDLSLAELIEFFCNQRKTGRLKIAFKQAPGLFYIKDGELVDARLGVLVGAEAVYYALTLPNASFDFKGHVPPPDRTIDEPWTHIVLEGLRRMDEGIAPKEAFPAGARYSYVEELDAQEPPEAPRASEASQRVVTVNGNGAPKAPLAMTVDSAAGSGRRKIMLAGVVAAMVMICTVAVGVLTDWFGAGRASSPVNAAAMPKVEAPLPSPSPAEDPSAAATSTPDAAADKAVQDEEAAQAARREARERELRQKLAAERAEAAKQAATPAGINADAARKQESAPADKTIMVRVLVDAEGRVEQASVASSRPGMESYESSALRIARQRRYPAGKSGWVTVPIKFN